MFENEKLAKSKWWVDRFFWCIPAQANSKKNVAGFGYYLKQVHYKTELEYWFGDDKPYNLAVTTFPAALILDFDDADLYARWKKLVPSEALTYTERTPSGGYHVFFYTREETTVPKGITLRAGVEIKNTVLVYPSVVDGKEYQRGVGGISSVNPVHVLSPLREPGTPKHAEPRTYKATNKGTSVLSKIKAELPVDEVLTIERPGWEIKRAPNGRWLSCRCPFHDDSTASMWIDINRNLWGCHACKAHGDVVNLYALFHGLTVKDALQVLAAEVKR